MNNFKYKPMKAFKFLTILMIIAPLISIAQEKEVINQLLTNWHEAASSINQESYFSFIDENGIYIGTDSTEIWTKQEFYVWSTPHFESNKTWNFKATNRNIYLSDDKTLAWFDELVDYGKGKLRGSGVLQKKTDGWKIMHYVLSVPVPNEKFVAVMDVINYKSNNN